MLLELTVPSKTSSSLTAQTLDLFKVVVIESEGLRTVGTVSDDVAHGYVTNFLPTKAQTQALREAFKPLPITTLFSVEERKTADPVTLIRKQVLHYWEVYGLGTPGLFNLELTNGKVVVVANITGVTTAELGVMVRNLLYTNAPIRKLEDLIEIVRFYDVDYDLTKVQNNEARIRLYRDGDRFADGDDAVRYIVYKTTDDSMLIKSPKVIAGVKANASRISLVFLAKHEHVLAQVFNRHKRIIVALKDRKNKTFINRISRFSKTLHVPITMAINKTFIAKVLKGEIKTTGILKALKEHITLRDKFKYLNLIEWRMLGRTDDIFVVRNGKAHLENNRPVWNKSHLVMLRRVVLASIEEDLAHLKGKKILLDEHVNFGLPTTQKQMFGNLPFGTEVSVDGDTIVSGVYWHNDGGAYDIDLSAIDVEGERTGWGDFSGYDRTNPITFSGDVTNAPDGAMEFLTSRKTYAKPYGLYVNNFNGSDNPEVSLVVGHQTTTRSGKTRDGHGQRWIENPVVREKVKLGSNQMIWGFVRDGKFVVYSLQASNSRVSGSEITKRLIAKALAPAWTIQRLFDELGIKYDTAAIKFEGAYDYDMTYASFSVDKLENMLFNR